jgi:hypothetical protein
VGDNLVDSAHEWADDNDLCQKFDQFMESQGLPGREREFTVSVSVSLTVNVDLPVTARSEQAARDEQFCISDLENLAAERVSRDGVYAVDVDDWSVFEVEPR